MNRLLSLFICLACCLGGIPAVGQTIDRIAILGCIRQDRPLPALKDYCDLDADLHLWLGDNIYADTDSPEVIRACYENLRKKPHFDELRRQGSHMFTWDDHDYGDNNVGKHYPLKAESKSIFVEFWGLSDDIPDAQEGIWYSKIFDDGKHKLQVIMLDVRYHRDEPNTNGEMLGEEQMKWLAGELKKPADLRLVVTGTQMLLPKEAGSETWDEYPEARERLYNAIRESDAEHLVFLTGDQHYAEVARQPDALGYDLVEFEFCGVNQIEEPEFNPFRVSPVCQSTNSYCYIDIQWEADDYHVPHLDFRVCNADTDQVEITYRVNFCELETPRPKR